MTTFFKILLFYAGFSSVFANASINNMPPDFVQLSSVAPEIIQSKRYASRNNFLGRPMVDYHQKGIYCTRALAHALKKVSNQLHKQGYALVVYDAYRSQHTVDSFVAWSKTKGDQAGKADYYPSIAKEDLFKLGYIFAKSGHSRGSTVDLTIIPLKQQLQPVTVRPRRLKNGEVIPFSDDNTLDMGSSFDLFHPVSHHGTRLINQQQIRRRQLLYDVMIANGFKGIKEEWWHYTLVNEPYPTTYFDSPS